MFLRLGPCFEYVKPNWPSVKEPAIGISIIPGTPYVLIDFDKSSEKVKELKKIKKKAKEKYITYFPLGTLNFATRL